jgi:hypothetical protein
MKKLILLAVISGPAWAGPYIEMGADYDATPPTRYHQHTHNGIVTESSSMEASNYIGIVSVGWEWDFKQVLSDQDSMTIRAKVAEHRSDIFNEGKEDIVNENDIRGVNVKYRFW